MSPSQTAADPIGPVILVRARPTAALPQAFPLRPVVRPRLRSRSTRAGCTSSPLTGEEACPRASQGRVRDCARPALEVRASVMTDLLADKAPGRVAGGELDPD